MTTNDFTPPPVHTLEFNAKAVSFFERQADEQKKWLPDVIAEALEGVVGRDAEQKSHVGGVALDDLPGVKKGGLRCHVSFSPVASQNLRATADGTGIAESAFVAHQLSEFLVENDLRWKRHGCTVHGVRPKIAATPV